MLHLSLFAQQTRFMPPSVARSIRRGLRELCAAAKNVVDWAQRAMTALVEGAQELFATPAAANTPTPASAAPTRGAPTPASVAPTQAAPAAQELAPTVPASVSSREPPRGYRPSPSGLAFRLAMPLEPTLPLLPPTREVTAWAITPSSSSQSSSTPPAVSPPTAISPSSLIAAPGTGPTPSALALHARTGTPVLRVVHREVEHPEMALRRELVQLMYSLSPQRRGRPAFRWVFVPGETRYEQPLPPRRATHLHTTYTAGWFPCRCPECVAEDPSVLLPFEPIRPREVQPRLRSFSRGGRLTQSTASALSARLNDASLTTRSWGRTRV